MLGVQCKPCWREQGTGYNASRAKHKFQLTREAFHSLANIARHLHVRRGVGKIKLNELPSLRMHTHGKRHQFLAEGTVLMTDSDQLWEKIVP